MKARAIEEEVKPELVPAVVPVLALGTSDVPGAVACLEEDVVAYVSGRCVAMFSHDPNKIRVSEPCREVRAITALTVSTDHKWLAVAEDMVGTRPPQITIMRVDHALERGTVLHGPHVERFVNVSFSGDGQMISACSSADDDRGSVFHVWEWNVSSEPASSGIVPGQADKVTINPRFTSNVVVQSASDIFYLRLSPSGYKQHPVEGLTKSESAQFVDHTWLADGRLVVASSDQKVMLLEGVQVQYTITLQRSPTCLLALPDGLLAVAMSRGHIDLYKPGNKEHGQSGTLPPMVHQASLKLPVDTNAIGVSDGSVKSMSCDAKGGHVACYVRKGALHILHTGLAKSSAVAKASGDALWEELLPAPHTGAIVSASFAVRKDLLATAGEDLTVRVWSWSPLRLVAMHLCHHTPLALAMDPWGAELIVTYVDSVKVYSVVEGMLLEIGTLRMPGEGNKPAAELVKCSIAAWSPTGAMIALAGGEGQKEVLVFSTLHRTLLARLRGHYSSIQDIAWSSDGLYIVSVSDGAVYTWHTETFRRHKECTIKGWFNSSVTCTPDFMTILVGDSSQGVRVFDNTKTGEVEQQGAPTPVSRAKTPATRVGGGYSGGTAIAGRPSGVASAGGEVVAPGELVVEAVLQGIMQPIRAGLVAALSDDCQALVGAGIMGRLRLSTLPPASAQHYQEFCLHTAEICVVKAHHQGRFILTADSAGTWMIHALLPPVQYEAHAAAFMGHSPRVGGRAQGQAPASEGTTGRGAVLTALPPYGILSDLVRGCLGKTRAQDGSVDVLTVRAVDMALMKDTLREMRDKLAKAATEADYRVYEKEQEVRKKVDNEITRWREEAARLQRELKGARDALTAAEADAQQERTTLAEQYAQGLRKEREKFESRLAVEIERTNASESEVGRVKAKFGKKLWQVEEDHKQEASAARERVVVLEQHVTAVQHSAANTIDKAFNRMENEIRLDSELNEEEVVRISATSKVKIEEKEESYMRLLAKHTLQTGLTAKTNAQNEELVKANEVLAKENGRLAEQVSALMEELNAMHAAWAERDVKQRLADVEARELAHQVAQGRMYTSLATGRIQELAAEIEPLRESRAAAQTEIARLEALQVRQAERRIKAMSEFEDLKAKLEYAQAEMARVKAAAKQKDDYFTNFATQLFRVTHSLPVERWALLFGRLHADYQRGKDKLDWFKYADTDVHTVAGERELRLTEREYKEQLAELQAQVVHTEKMMSQARETRAREGEAHRNLVSRLQGENLDLLAQLNEAKKDIKDAKSTIDKLNVELYRIRHQSRGAAGSIASHPSALSLPASHASYESSATGGGSRAQRAATARLQRGASQGAGAAAAAGSGVSFGVTGSEVTMASGAPSHQRPTTSPVISASAAMGGLGNPGSPRAAGSYATPAGGAIGAPSEQLGAGVGGASGGSVLFDIPEARTAVGSNNSPSKQRQGGGSHGRVSPGRSGGAGAASAGPSSLLQPAGTVTGEMPSGGWWLGSNSLFEVPSNLSILKGDLPPAHNAHGSHGGGTLGLGGTGVPPLASNLGAMRGPRMESGRSRVSMVSSTYGGRPGTSDAYSSGMPSSRSGYGGTAGLHPSGTVVAAAAGAAALGVSGTRPGTSDPSAMRAGLASRGGAGVSNLGGGRAAPKDSPGLGPSSASRASTAAAFAPGTPQAGSLSLSPPRLIFSPPTTAGSPDRPLGGSGQLLPAQYYPSPPSTAPAGEEGSAVLSPRDGGVVTSTGEGPDQGGRAGGQGDDGGRDSGAGAAEQPASAAPAAAPPESPGGQQGDGSSTVAAPAPPSPAPDASSSSAGAGSSIARSSGDGGVAGGPASRQASQRSDRSTPAVHDYPGDPATQPSQQGSTSSLQYHSGTTLATLDEQQHTQGSGADHHQLVGSLDAAQQGGAHLASTGSQQQQHYQQAWAIPEEEGYAQSDSQQQSGGMAGHSSPAAAAGGVTFTTPEEPHHHPPSPFATYHHHHHHHQQQLTGQAAQEARAALAARSVSLPAGYLYQLSGQVRPTAPSRLTTMGAGFRSFVPRSPGALSPLTPVSPVGGAGGLPGSTGSTPSRGSSRQGPRRG